MAEVFEGELAGELGFVRRIAIKRMLADAARDPVAAQRFVDEARIASRLHHANIVAVLDVGLLDGLPFQVLELVDGVDVAQLMARAGGTLPLAAAVIVAGDVAHALEHAHAAVDDAGVGLGIVHRDVKPSNVLVSWSGDVKLTDFGIAIAHDRAARTEAGVVAGTFGFMAPEQRTRGAVDGRSDVFALGLALHAMVVGQSPLHDVQVEMRALAGEAIPIDDQVPADIARVIAGAIAIDRRARPTAAELATQLDAVAAARVAGGDRRGALRELLERVRGDRGAGAAKRGALDALLGLDVVPVPSASGAPAAYELREAAEPTQRADASDDIATRADAPRARTRGRRAKTAAITVGVVVAATLGGVALWDSFPTPPLLAAREPARDAAVAVDARAAPARDAALAVAVDAAAAPVDAATTHAHVTRPPPVAPAAAIDAGVAAGTGFLQVVGADLVGARVTVDNAVAGYAPAKLELARGRHTLVVTRQDGSQLPPQHIEITDRDTFASPLRPAW
jgi:hypothetical protein